MKKICHISSVHKLNDVRIFHKQCVSLAAAGYDVILIACDANIEPNNGVTLLKLKGKGNRLFRILFGNYYVYRLAKAQEADIYHFHDPELLPYGFFLKLMTKAKVVYDSHECYPDFFLQKEWIHFKFRKLLSRLVKVFEDYVVNRIDLVVAATPHISKRFASLKTHVVTINNYPLKNEFSFYGKMEDGKEKDGFCYVGTINELRGIIYLLDALDYIPKGIEFYLAGTFTDSISENKAKNHKNWNRVKFMGQVGRSGIYEIFKKSFAGIVTLLPAPNHIFSQPVKLYEYMAWGLPVICSDFEEWKKIVQSEKCGLSVNPTSAYDIGFAINYLFAESKIRKRMSENGVRLIRTKYAWEFEAAKLLSAYEDILYEN